jgi:hypothetical protein
VLCQIRPRGFPSPPAWADEKVSRGGRCACAVLWRGEHGGEDRAAVVNRQTCANSAPFAPDGGQRHKMERNTDLQMRPFYQPRPLAPCGEAGGEKAHVLGKECALFDALLWIIHRAVAEFFRFRCVRSTCVRNLMISTIMHCRPVSGLMRHPGSRCIIAAVD